MNKYKTAICRVLDKFPLVAKKIPYWTALVLSKKILLYRNIGIADIWPRNSYQFNNLIPAISDLDLTILWKKNANQTQIEHFIKTFRFLSKIIPILSESNHYTISDTRAFTPVANFFEITRDPQLVKSLSYSPAADNDYKQQAITFISRMLYSDLYGLQHYPSLRLKKWDFHIKQISEKLQIPPLKRTNIGIDEIIEKLSNLTGHPAQELKQLFLLPHRFSDAALLRNKLFASFFPHKWVGVVIMNSSIDEGCAIVRSMNPKELSIFSSQIEWEIWGLLGQIPLIEDMLGFHRHLYNLKLLLQACPEELHQGLKINRKVKAIEMLIEIASS